MSEKNKSKIFAAIHETAQDFHTSGLMAAKTMREFDKSCLKPKKELTPGEILAELEVLEAMPEEDINFTDIPEISDWSDFEVGKFYRPVKKSVSMRFDAIAQV